jgi:hypothetical protein
MSHRDRALYRTPAPRAPLWFDRASRVLARRTIADPATGEWWNVAEVDTTGLPGAQAAACLLFDGDIGVRRVWDYPAAWQNCPTPICSR